MDKELSEIQFTLLKRLCERQVYIVMVPTLLEGDPTEYKEKYETGMADIRALVDMGFMENITEKFNEMLTEVTKDGGRGFEAFLITESTVRMFTPGASVQ